MSALAAGRVKAPSGSPAKRVIAAGIMVAWLAGCGSTPGTTDPTPGTTELPSGLAVARSEGGTPGEGDAALLEGTVVDSGGCLAIRHDDADWLTIPVFDVLDPRAQELRVGDRVALGGGTIPVHDGLDIPQECAGEEEYYLVVME